MKGNQMSFLVKRLTPFVFATAASLFAGSSFALTCTVVDKNSTASTATPVTTFAVASNFYSATQSLVKEYLTSVTSSSAIRVCHDSSGTLLTEITGTPTYPYTLFLSADASRPATLKKSYSSLIVSGASPFKYASGIPVLYVASGTASDYVLTGQSGSTATADGMTGVKIDLDSVSKLAIGNISSAPYGTEAVVILTAMAQWNNGSYLYNAGAVYSPSTSGSCTLGAGSGKWICEYNNIDITLSAITTGDATAGIVSWGQVCSAPNSQYVKFTSYPIEQDGILLNLSGATDAGKALAAAVVSYMNLGSSTWNSWLATKCYGAI
jgi:ABC-type molybdate transport system substrate-binding protein